MRTKTREYFQTSIPLDSYNVGRIEISRGANAILFGVGSPAGIINNNLKKAETSKDTRKATVQFGRYGTRRLTADYNQVIVPDRLAMRLNGVNESRHFQQEFKYDDTRRYTIAANWKPKLIGSTELNLHYEAGKIDANRPRPTPPEDGLSLWFDPQALNKLKVNSNDPIIDSIFYIGVDGALAGNTAAMFSDPTSGSRAETSPRSCSSATKTPSSRS